MAWPSVTEFTGAVQQPSLFFDDPELKSSHPVIHPMRGMPLVRSGNFAAVYEVVAQQGRKFAVKCFTRTVNDQQIRYGHLNEYLRYTLPPTLVEFEFQEKGILVQGEWYPIVKMEWVNGVPLNRYVETNLSSPAELTRIARRWRGAVGDLLSREIAHNDLQHGNVLIQPDSTIRLVDYDGIFLPRYLGEPSPEIGHQNFAHPQRTAQDYAGYVDNFPSLIIYISLLALARDPDLWNVFYNEDNLLFTKSDYADPASSECFRALKGSSDDTVRQLVGYLEDFCHRPVSEVPDLETILNGGGNSPFVAPPTTVPPTGAVSEYRRLMQMRQQGASSTAAPKTPVVPAANPKPAPPVTVPPASSVATEILCPECNVPNPRDLIWCSVDGCHEVLHPGRLICSACGRVVPVNVSYCTHCGRKMN